MASVLLPCDGTPHALGAVRRVVEAFREGHVQAVHLLNVQPPFSAYVSRHVDRELRDDYHRECADLALAEARRLLDAAGVAHTVHTVVGDKLHCILDAVRRLPCDRVVVGSARKSALVRAVENSFTARLLERCPVPVEVVGGEPASAVERYGIPAGVGAGGALLWIAAT